MIHIRHANGKLTRIERDIPQVQMSSAERERFLNPVTGGRGTPPPAPPEVPRVKPFISNLVAAQDGRIWVQLNRPQAETNEETSLWEVFAPDGHYLGRVLLPYFVYAPTAITGNSVWNFRTSASGVPQLVEFVVTPGLRRIGGDDR